MSHPPVPDVLVLGAGAAGLAAGLTLATAGKRVTILEARSRIGGRIFTQHVAAVGIADSIPVELGAEFIHGLPVETWNAVRTAGLETYELDGAQLRFANGRLQCAPEASGSRNILEEMTRWQLAQPQGTDETFEQYLNRSATTATPDMRNEAIRYVEGFNAADHRVIGVAALARQQTAEQAVEADRLFHFGAGYSALPQSLLARFEQAGGRLCLGTAVASIAWHAGRVVMAGTDLAGSGFEFSARQAIITLPVGVLQAGSVAFTPAPRAALAAVRRMAMGSVIRISLIFRSRFWSDASLSERTAPLAAQLRKLSFLFTDHAVPATWWTSHPNRSPLLVAWVAGPEAQRLNKDRLIDLCLRTLAMIFDCSEEFLCATLVSGHFHDWDADPYSGGAYSYMPAGALDASQLLSSPVEGTLYFAGEHTTISGHWGTVHGALQAGEAAASALLAAHTGL